ncbi:hypothetical protein F183_A11260 [Bryobacterales bacterium F-183]|nr:hypothetical protein F183_A11260 [Bryobacterales bacterium F-183]
MKVPAYLALSLFTLTTLPARADIALNWLSNGYIDNAGHTVGTADSPLSANLQPAARFTSLKTGLVSQIDLAVWYLPDIVTDPRVTVSLWTDSGFGPGTLLGSWDYSSTLTSVNCCNFDSIQTPNGPLLQKGQSYVLGVNGRGAFMGGWAWTNFQTSVYRKFNNGSWQFLSNTAPAARIYVTPTAAVPEPSSVCVLASMAGFALFFRRRVRIDGTPERKEPTRV